MQATAQVKQPLPRESDLQREKFQKTVNQNLRRIEQRLKPGDCKSTQHLKVYEEKQVTFSRLKPNNADSLHIPKNKCFKLRELSPARGREHACRKVERPGTSQTVHFSKIQSNVKLKTKADDFHKKQVRNTSNQSKQVLRIGTHANNADLKKSCCLYNTARKFGKKRTCLIQNDDGSYTRKTIVLVSFPRNPHKFSISCSQQQSTPSQLSSSSYTTCTGQKEEADIAQNAFLRGKSALGSHSSLYVKCPNQKIDFHENDAHWDVRKTDIYLQKEASANCPIPPQSTRLKPLQQRIPLTTPLESLSANEMSSTVTVAPRRAKPLKYKSAGSRRETDASSVVSNLAKSFLCGTCFEMDAYDENSSSLDSVETGSGEDGGSDSGGEDDSGIAGQFEDASDVEAIEYFSVSDGDGSEDSSDSDKHSGYEDEVLQNEEMDLLRYMQETADHELQDAFLQNDSREDFSFVDEEERMIACGDSYFHYSNTSSDSNQENMEILHS